MAPETQTSLATVAPRVPASPSPPAQHPEGPARCDRERAQHQRRSIQGTVCGDDRRGALPLRLLPDPGVRLGLDAGGQFGAFGRGERGPVDGRAPFAAGDRLDEQVGEVGEDVRAAGGLAAPPGGRAGQRERLVEQRQGRGGQERQEPGVLGDARAQPVDDRHRAQPRGLQQPGHAEVGVLAQVEGVAPGGVDAAQDHVHRFEPPRAVMAAAHRALPHAAFADGQLRRQHQREPQP